MDRLPFLYIIKILFAIKPISIHISVKRTHFAGASGLSCKMGFCIQEISGFFLVSSLFLAVDILLVLACLGLHSLCKGAPDHLLSFLFIELNFRLILDFTLASTSTQAIKRKSDYNQSTYPAPTFLPNEPCLASAAPLMPAIAFLMPSSAPLCLISISALSLEVAELMAF